MSDFERRTPSRELGSLRKRYLDHREAIGKLMSDAPTDRLAQSYGRIRAEIEDAIRKIDEIEGGARAAAVTPGAVEPPTGTHPALRGASEAPAELAVDHELLRDPTYDEPPPRRAVPAAAIVAVVLVFLGLLAFLVWRSAGNRKPAPTPTIVEEPLGPEPAAAEALDTTPAAAAVAPELVVSPSSFDYGLITKRTRKAQKFTVTNNTGAPLTVRASRSQCRCLWFQHPDSIPPGGSAAMSITIDGGRAKAGALAETVEISSKENAAVTAVVSVRATIQ